MRGMKILIEITDETGEALDALAKRENRSRTRQATKIVSDFLAMADTDPTGLAAYACGRGRKEEV
jgi:predicted transcriptional regulator